MSPSPVPGKGGQPFTTLTSGEGTDLDMHYEPDQTPQFTMHFLVTFHNLPPPPTRNPNPRFLFLGNKMKIHTLRNKMELQEARHEEKNC